MIMMKTHTTALLLIFLASCVSIPPRPIYQYKHFSNSCAVRCFDYNRLKITKDSDCGQGFKTDLRRPARDCDGVLGPYVNDYAEDIKPRALDAIQACEDRKN
jgi:hypothetical protein